MLLEKPKASRFISNKHFHPQVTSPVQSITYLKEKVITLDDFKVIRVFHDLKGSPIEYPLKDQAALYANITAVPKTNYLALWGGSQDRSIGFVHHSNFMFCELGDFAGVYAVCCEEKALTVVDSKGVHIYYVSQGYTKLNVFKLGVIHLSKIMDDSPSSNPVRHYLAKQVNYTLYLLKFIKKTQNGDYHYRFKLYYLPRFYKGFHRKASFHTSQQISDFAVLGPRALVALTTVDSQLLVLNLESKVLIKEPGTYGSLRPYKAVGIGLNGELVAFELKRTVVISTSDDWAIVYESKVDQDTGDRLVNDAVEMGAHKVLYAEGSKICILKEQDSTL